MCFHILKEILLSQVYINKLKKKQAILFKRYNVQQKQQKKIDIESYIKILNFDLKFNQI